MEENLNFFFNNNTSQPKKENKTQKKLKLNNTIWIKSRNVLTNRSYNGVKEKDLLDRNFVFNAYVSRTRTNKT